MPSDVYDDPEFFRRYAELGRSVAGLAGAPEWPSLRALLPEMRGRRVVDLGCGYGWFCRWAREQGAAAVLGLDGSEKMLARAQAMTADSGIAYRRADLEELQLDERAFDLAFSSLTLHYIQNLAGLFATLHRALVAGSRLVFSMEHPIYTAPSRPEWVTAGGDRTVWALDRYLVEGERRTDWLGGNVVKRHRTLGSLLNLLIGAGFALSHVEEWTPTDEQVAARPEWAKERDRPMFLLVGARR